MSATLLPLAAERIAALDAAYLARCRGVPLMGKAPRAVAWSLEHRDGKEMLPGGWGRQQDAKRRAQAVRLANETSASVAAAAFGVSERSIVRWRNGHVKKVAP